MKLIEMMVAPFEYKGYTISFDEDSDGFLWINYDPKLPQEVDLKYNKASNSGSAMIVAREGVNAALKYQPR